MKGHYEIILKSLEDRVESMLGNLVTDRKSPNCGGFINRQDGMVHPGSATGSLATLIPLYLNEDSMYYRSDRLYNDMLIILGYIKRVQRPDGTFDLLTTNLYSSPDTGFIMYGLANAYKVLEKYGNDEKCAVLKEKLFNIIKNCGYGMVTGGFHTPNHRWVISSALMLAYNIVKEEAFRAMAEQYLAEGIDCDENGEYTERSPGIYNAVNDNALIVIADELGRPELLEHVKRNLDMMFTYIEPDGSVFTQNSSRIDKGEGSAGQKFYPVRYYDLYLYMAYKMKDGRYAAMADLIFRNSYEYGSNVPNLLYLFMLKPELKEFCIEKLPIPTQYKKFYKESGIVRVRNGNFSYTLLKNSSSFIFVQNGNLRCYVKLCASFFAVAQFKAQTLEETSDGYTMTFKAHGAYRMPFEEAPGTSDWKKMDHSKRKTANELDLIFKVSVTDIHEGLRIRVCTEGCDRVPVKMELGFSAHSNISAGNFTLKGGPGQSMISREGYIEVRKEQDVLVVGPGFGEHEYTTDMRGSEPQNANDFTIYYTDFTNMDRTIEIRKG